MRITGFVSAGIIAAALAVAGCGTDDGEGEATDEPSAAAASSSESTSPEASAEPTVEPAQGKVLKAKGFSFSVPKGWADVTEQGTDDVLIRAADLSGNDEVPAQLTVGTVPGGKSALQTLADRGARALASKGITHVRLGEPAEIDGAPAAQVEGVQPQKGAPLAVDRYYVVTDAGAWEVTFSANRWLMKADRERTIDSILASWNWE